MTDQFRVAETGRDRDGKGFVEFENAADLKTAVEKLDKREFKGAVVECTEDVSSGDPIRITDSICCLRTICPCRSSSRLPWIEEATASAPHRLVLVTLVVTISTIDVDRLRLATTANAHLVATIVVDLTTIMRMVEERRH